MSLPPPDPPARCKGCGEPVTPYTVETHRFNGHSATHGPLTDFLGDPVHIPDQHGLFYFSCGFARHLQQK